MSCIQTMITVDGSMIAVAVAAETGRTVGGVYSKVPMAVEVCGPTSWRLEPVKAIIFAATVDAFAREALRRQDAGVKQ